MAIYTIKCRVPFRTEKASRMVDHPCVVSETSLERAWGKARRETAQRFNVPSWEVEIYDMGWGIIK